MPNEHRKQRWWYILAPMLVSLALVVALAVMTALASNDVVAHAAGLVVICGASFLFVLGLPILGVLLWAAWRWPRLYRAIPRYTAKVLRIQTRIRKQVERASDRIARLVMAPRVQWARARALAARLKPRLPRRT